MQFKKQKKTQTNQNKDFCVIKKKINVWFKHFTTFFFFLNIHSYFQPGQLATTYVPQH